MKNKYENLKTYLKKLGSVAVSFSGGVDSTFLLKAAHSALGDGAVAVTVRAHSFPKREIDEAVEFCKKEGIRHILVDFDEFSVEGFAANPQNRCYLCKTELFKRIKEAVAPLGITSIAEGSNKDDEGDYRPGMLAVKEHNILSPLREVGLTKTEIRALSKELGIAIWNKPSFACLASRFVYGEEITPEKLQMVGKAEQFILSLGFEQVRVRIHGSIARIEITPDGFSKMIGVAGEVNEYLKSLGFTYVSLDLAGYRTGSMNETLA